MLKFEKYESCGTPLHSYHVFNQEEGGLSFKLGEIKFFGYNCGWYFDSVTMFQFAGPMKLIAEKLSSLNEENLE